LATMQKNQPEVRRYMKEKCKYLLSPFGYLSTEREKNQLITKSNMLYSAMTTYDLEINFKTIQTQMTLISH